MIVNCYLGSGFGLRLGIRFEDKELFICKLYIKILVEFCILIGERGF